MMEDVDSLDCAEKKNSMYGWPLYKPCMSFNLNSLNLVLLFDKAKMSSLNEKFPHSVMFLVLLCYFLC